MVLELLCLRFMPAHCCDRNEMRLYLRPRETYKNASSEAWDVSVRAMSGRNRTQGNLLGPQVGLGMERGQVTEPAVKNPSVLSWGHEVPANPTPCVWRWPLEPRVTSP